MSAEYSLQKIPGKSLSEQVYSAIRLSILEENLDGGQALCIDDLAAELGVSTTPVREALARLAADGLVALERNKNPIVVSINEGEISQIHTIRRLLEPYYAQSLASRASKDPSVALSLRMLRKAHVEHLATLGSESNEESSIYAKYMELELRMQQLLLPSTEDLLGKIASLVNNHALRLRIFSRESSQRSKVMRIQAVGQEHLHILDALIDGDVPAIEREIVNHLMHSEERSLTAQKSSHNVAEKRGSQQLLHSTEKRDYHP